jgi:hypothetical protein
LSRARFHRFFGLRKEYQILLLRTLCIVVFVRILLWVFPLTSLRRGITAFSSRLPTTPKTISRPECIAWAVTVASRWLFRSTCLVQALAAQILLASEGIPSTLHIGVRKGEQSPIDAHAWVEVDGKIIIGGADRISYKKLVSLQV